MKMVIIDILVSIGEKRALPVLQAISRDQECMDIVRQKAISGKQKIIFESVNFGFEIEGGGVEISLQSMNNNIYLRKK